MRGRHLTGPPSASPCWTRRSAGQVVAVVLVVVPVAVRADAGRFVAVSAGVTLGAPVADDDPPPVPWLLRSPPEIQVAWGLRLGDSAVLLTRIDLLGTMVPVGPSGIGLDVGGGWYP